MKVELAYTLPHLEKFCGIRIYSFISDFSGGIIKMRIVQVEEEMVDWAYGCVADAHNNFSKNLGNESFG